MSFTKSNYKFGFGIILAWIKPVFSGYGIKA